MRGEGNKNWEKLLKGPTSSNLADHESGLLMLKSVMREQ